MVKPSLAILIGLNLFLALTLSLGNYQFYYAYQPYEAYLTIFSKSIDMAVWFSSSFILTIASLIYAYRKSLWRWMIKLSFSLIVIILLFLVFVKGLHISLFQLVSIIPSFFLHKECFKLNKEAINLSLIAFLTTPFIISLSSLVARFLALLNISIKLINLLEFDLQLFYLGYPIGAYLSIIVIFSWFWIWFLKPVKAGDLGKAVNPLVFLECAIGLSFLIAYLPCILNANFMGVDTEWYISALLNQFSAEALIKPRGLYLGLLKAISAVIGVNQAVKIAPAILNIFHVLAIYLLTSYSWDRHSGALASIFAIFPTAMVSLYAGIYANWLSLSLIFLSFYFFIKASEKNSKLLLFFSIFSLALAALNHPWAGGITLAIYTTTLLITYFSFKTYRSLKFVFILLVFFILAGLASTLLDFKILLEAFSVLNALNPRNMTYFFSNLSYTLKFYVGGFFDAPLLYFLALIGVVNILKAKSVSKPLFTAWLIVCSLFAILSSLWMLWRILYLMPLQILAGLGVAWLASMLNDSSKAAKPAYIMLISLIIFNILNYTLRGIGLLLSSLA
ncbi:MAG: hypothetical protein QW303_02275 [Nitrososphaerota archaeon]